MTSIPSSRRGFSLVEVTVALGIAAFCLISLLGLLSVSLNSNQNAIQQTGASRVATAIMADLRATQTMIPVTVTSPLFGISLPATGTATRTFFLTEDGSPAGLPGANADPSLNPRYRATIVLTAPATGSQKIATMARLFLTWPALADGIAATTPANYSGSFEVMGALDRN